MFETALIALDHSAAQGPMLDCLTDLRDLGVKSVVLTHIVQVGYAQGAGYGHEEALNDWLAERAAPLREVGLDVVTDIRAAGQVATGILEAATDHGADLIVIGSRGQNMMRGLFLGSVAREVVRLSGIPVRLEWIEINGEDGAASCERACHAGLRRVLVATDFSVQARAAEHAAAELGTKAQAVDLIHVATVQEQERYTQWRAMAHAALEKIAEEINAAGGKPEVHLAQGKPSEAIARLAAERDADLVIVGKHGQSWVESMVTGSTATNLCEIARRPVLVVPLESATG
ncbi:MAG: universal stress protein [Salinarimonas sp.]|nr:universal stress protein [Salinarimonas sp.]